MVVSSAQYHYQRRSFSLLCIWGLPHMTRELGLLLKPVFDLLSRCTTLR